MERMQGLPGRIVHRVIHFVCTQGHLPGFVPSRFSSLSFQWREGVKPSILYSGDIIPQPR